MGTANWGWFAVCVAMSALTYLASAIALAGSVPRSVPFTSNVEAQMASSFVNRVTPANVGGMALSVRFLQKAGIAPAEAVTGLGLNVLVGAIVHIVLLVVFLAFSRADGTGGSRSRPGASSSSASRWPWRSSASSRRPAEADDSSAATYSDS